jgi:RNA polymerase sigma-70 factor (ECF subfamily)
MPLLERLLKKENKAQLELYRQFNSRLFTFFRLRIKGEDHYEDLVQEVFASFFEAIEKIPNDESIAPYLFGIAKNTVFNYFYKQKKQQNLQKKCQEQQEVVYHFCEQDKLDTEKLTALVNVHMKKLKEKDRIILKEFYINEKEVTEIADILKKSNHYVSVRKERAIKKIKNEILKHNDLYNKHEEL